MANHKLKYPEAPRDENIITKYQGMKVTDAYRWLEKLDSQNTQDFITQQNALTEKYLDGCPVREMIKNCVTSEWNYPRTFCPFRRGNNYYFYYNAGLLNQNVLHVQTTLDSEPTVFLDPNLLSDDGTTALIEGSFSDDGTIFAYGLSQKGSEWVNIYFRNTLTSKDYQEVIGNVKFSDLAWTKDNHGLFYARYPKEEKAELLKNQRLYHHQIGTRQTEDILVVEFRDHPYCRIGATVSYCGRYLIVTPREGVNDNHVFYAELPPDGIITGLLQLKEIVIDHSGSFYSYITNDDSEFIFLTNKDAPNRCITKVHIEDTPKSWKMLIQEDPNKTLCWSSAVHSTKLLVCYMENIRHILQLRDLKTGVILKDFPIEMGTIDPFAGRRDDTEIFFRLTSFLTPQIIYRCDLTQDEYQLEIYHETKLKELAKEDYVVEQKFYTSTDEAEVPMYIIHERSLDKNGKAPCLLYGYGGYELSLLPQFNTYYLIFMKYLGGIVAIANVRGGGEVGGKKWHDAGRKLNKQNTFNDFKKAADFLVKNSYTSKTKLIAQGYSNGGLTVAASINQKPNLFAAAIIQDGVLDLLRFNKFTIGHAWVAEYGSADVKEDFNNLMKISPLHNIKKPSEWQKQYPAVFVLVSDNDDRVVPIHSLKFIAELQYQLKGYERQNNPLLIRMESDAGHGVGKPLNKRIVETADILTFIVHSLNLKFEFQMI